jgi:hypothetical protein
MIGRLADEALVFDAPETLSDPVLLPGFVLKLAEVWG